MRREVVVAKYKEDMGWIKNVPWPTIVYDKHKAIGRHDFPHVRYEELDNPQAGRESHSYIYHILKNYSNLADITFFVQGKPFDHCGMFLEAILYEYQETIGLGAPSHGNIIVPSNYTLNYNGPPFPWKLSVRKPNDNLMRKWSFLFPDKTPPSEFVYAWGQQYAVPKHRILQRSYGFYYRMFQELRQHKSHHELNTDAYSLEYLSFYVWGDEWRHGYPDKLRKLPPRCMG